MELVYKVYAISFYHFFYSIGNIFDSFIIIVSLIDAITVYALSSTTLLGKLKVLRILRVLRPLRLISYYHSLKITLNSFIKSIKHLINITCFIFIFFIIYGIFGIVIFKGSFYYCTGLSEEILEHEIITMYDCLDYGGSWINPVLNFDNIGNALTSLFVLSTTNGWVDLLA